MLTGRLAAEYCKQTKPRETSSMFKIALLSLLTIAGLQAQTNPVQELIEAARTDSPKLKELLAAKDMYGHRIPELNGRDGVAVSGQEFLFAIETQKDAGVS